ncbi:F-box/FBD/LRR-repeat protein [Cardamine amara subsp. amara]|uniref:F-box/FBD/LRR-repeat protein n=1 Tax=Cardamine amara subsp. amara TaxID=228776 RepID=A0ABD1BVH7_CARAN
MVRTSLNTCLDKKMLKKPKGLVRTSLNTCLYTRKTKKPRVLEKEDSLSNLPNDLLCLILSKLSTKDSVCTSVLSKRWRNLWLQVPVLNLDFDDFGPDEFDFLQFLDRFLQSNSELNIERFNLIYDVDDHFQDDFLWRINQVIKRRVCHLTVLNQLNVEEEDLVSMPLSLYTCATLVSLTLYCVAMDDDILRGNPAEKLVSLPCLKTMYLEGVIFDGSSILTTLISRCFVLEDLTLIIHLVDYLEKVNVCSQSLKSFKFHSLRREFEDDDSDAEIYDPENLFNSPDIVINAPRLEYMSISGYQPKSFEILSVGPFAKLNVDVWFYLKNNDTMIHNFLIGISTVCEMIISARSLKFIHKYSKMKPMEPLPQFSNLSRLDASLLESSWEFLPTFLGCCLKLRSLSMELDRLPEIEEIELSPVPQCVLSSLEFVKLKTATIADTPRKRELVRRFLMKNCAVLKKLILSEP